MSMSIAIQPTRHPATQASIEPANCRPLLKLAVAIVRQAKHARSLLWVEIETERLMRMHPDCHMLRDEVRSVLSRKAVDRRLDIAFG